MMISQILLLVLSSISLVYSQNTTIRAYFPNDTFIAFVEPGHFNTFASYYIVGDVAAPVQLEFWQPFDVTIGGNAVAAALLKHIQAFVNISNGNFSVKLFNADWSGVVGTPICGDPGSTVCPDIILIGTTQVATRVAANHTLDLSTFLSNYAAETGVVLNDDFIKYVFYDYFINGAWHAIPFIADFRIVGFNKTTFDNIGLKYPPPYGNWSIPWGQSWTWDVFADYAHNITQFTSLPGYTVRGCWDEEIKITMMMAQNYGVRLVNNGVCALNITDRFETGLRKSIYRMFVEDKSGNMDFIPLDATYEAWLQLNASEDDPLNEPGFCCECGYPDLIGMAIDAPGAFLGFKRWIPGYDTNGTIGLGLAPGQLSFLGGSGLVITQQSLNPSLAWDLLQYLIQPTNPNSCLQDVALATASIPPYDSALELPQWNTEEWTVPLLQIQHAAPEQYPLQTFPQFGDLENRHPFRLLWLNLIHKNMTLDYAIDRLCEVIDYIFQPPCTNSDWTFNVSECLLNSTRLVTYFWIQPQLCRGGVSYPQPMYINSCPYVPWLSAPGIGLTIATIILMLIVIGFAACFIILKDTKIIKLANVPFSLLVIFGGLLAYGSVLASIGNSVISCVLPTWMLSIGFILVFGSFDLKMYRLWKIFNNKSLVAHTIKDEDLFVLLGVIATIDVLLLLLWTFIPPNVYSTTVQTVQYFGLITVSEFSCSKGNSVSIALLFVFKGIIFVFGCYFSFALRNAPSDFKDREFVTVSISVLGFAAVVLIPVAFLLSVYLAFLLVSLGILVVTSFTLGMYAIPKILHGFGILELGEEMENFFNRKNVGMQCPTCKRPLGTTNTKQTTNQGPQKSSGVVIPTGNDTGTE